MSIYKKILEIRKQLPVFQFDRAANGDVKFVSDEQINKALVPLMDKFGVISIPHGEISGDQFNLTMEFICVEDDSKCVANMAFPIDKRNFEFGGTATLTEKYLYKMLFKIHTGEEGGVKLQTKDDIREEAFGTHDNSILEEMVKKFPDNSNPEKLIHYDLPPEKETVTFEDGTPNIKKVAVTEKTTTESLVTSVLEEQDIEELPVVAAEKKDPEPNETLHQKINEGGWGIKVDLASCINEAKAVQSLDKIYASLATTLYGHPDNELCPINPFQVIEKLPRRSNLKVRRPIIQFRVFGVEAFWQQMKVETGLDQKGCEDLLATPTKVEPEEKILPVIHELKLNFDIPEHLGTDRDEEACHKLLINLKEMGLAVFTIIYAFGKMQNKPTLTSTQDEPMILEFLSKASQLQIVEMIKIAKSAG